MKTGGVKEIAYHANGKDRERIGCVLGRDLEGPLLPRTALIVFSSMGKIRNASARSAFSFYRLSCGMLSK